MVLHLLPVPTRRPRHTITQTDEVTRALEVAARRWPEDGDKPGQLLLDLVREGHRAIVADSEQELAERRRGIERTRGELSGSYPPGYLERLRADWR